MEKIAIAATLLLASTQVIAATTIPHNFSAGDPARANDVNQNFSAVAEAIDAEVLSDETRFNDRAAEVDTRLQDVESDLADVENDIQTLESSVAAVGATSFDDYSQPTSASGALDARNVIVWQEGNSTCYVARLSFTNTTNIQVNGSIPASIFVWQYACGDNNNTTYELEYIYAANADFSEYSDAEINEDIDGDGSFDTDTAYDYQRLDNRQSLSNSVIQHISDIYKNNAGEIITATNHSSALSQLDGPITVNGMTFNDIVVENFIGFERVQFHARGIGPVLEINPNRDTLNGAIITQGTINSDPVYNRQTQRAIIYHRTNGATQGSLAGTPFAGNDLVGDWFD